MKKDIGDLEMAIQRAEQEKSAKDHTMKGLNDEVAVQDELINKLNKEKKHISENGAKSAEDLQAVIEKVDHLGNVKSKLEATREELEMTVEKEKRARTVVEKDRRRAEGELKMAQATVAEIERSKKELEAAIMRKDAEVQTMTGKLDDEQSLVGKVQKAIKDNQGRVEELEEELEAERQARAKAERQRSDLAREMESLGDRLHEAGGATTAQVELNKKRESEVSKLRKDLEESNIQHEATLNCLKKKQADSIAEMSEQTDQLKKMKAKVTKDCSQIHSEINDVRAATDEVARSKVGNLREIFNCLTFSNVQASADKSYRSLVDNLNMISKKVEESNLHLGDFENQKRRITLESADLMRQLQEMSANASLMVKQKAALMAALDEQRSVSESEAKERVSLLSKFKNLEHSADGLKENYDEEVGAKENLARQLTKALGDAEMWKQKYEIDGVAKAEELEMARLKLQARLSEGQAVIEQLSLKLAQLEKAKSKTSADVTEMAQLLDQAQIMHAAMEKKARQFDR